MFVFALALTIISNTLYHLFQKATSPDVNPALALALTYGVAMVFCLLLLPFIPLKTDLGQSLRQINWASYALGIAIVGLELGFLLAYRAGWDLSVAALVSRNCSRAMRRLGSIPMVVCSQSGIWAPVSWLLGLPWHLASRSSAITVALSSKDRARTGAAIRSGLAGSGNLQKLPVWNW